MLFGEIALISFITANIGVFTIAYNKDKIKVYYEKQQMNAFIEKQLKELDEKEHQEIIDMIMKIDYEDIPDSVVL